MYLKNNLQLLDKTFLSQTNTTPKNGILLIKMARLLKSSIFQLLIVKNRPLFKKNFYVLFFFLNIILVHE
jgi:hypothetical protein